MEKEEKEEEVEKEEKEEEEPPADVQAQEEKMEWNCLPTARTPHLGCGKIVEF